MFSYCCYTYSINMYYCVFIEFTPIAFNSSFYNLDFLLSFFLLQKNKPKTKFTILTTFNCTVQSHEIHPHHYTTITTIHLQNFFVFPNWFSVSMKQWHSITIFLTNPGNHILLSASMNLISLGIAYKWNYTVFIFLWLAYFTSYNISRFIHTVAWVRIPSF